jgi:hypothetical protein
MKVQAGKLTIFQLRIEGRILFLPVVRMADLIAAAVQFGWNDFI